MIFDKGQKKVCRYNQYYGIMRAQKRLTAGKGGIIWHTQGSGKSLTMIWLSKWLLANIPTARVLIVTDRDELDEQIEKNFKGVYETIVRTRSGADLLARLNSHEDRLLCSLIHKFGKRGGEATEKDYERYIEELKASLPANFKAKDDIFVFVDECHRTQSGKLHLAMKTIMPNAVFVGFTGTPLLKKDKATSIEVFGRYIHTYKFDEGVADGVVLDLRYEYRDIPQEIRSQDKIDAWFDAKTRGLMPRAKARLKQLWGTMQSVYSSRDRLDNFDDFTLLDFILAQREKLEGDESKSKEQESAAEAIENNIRRKVVEKIILNPKYYEKMSAVLEQLIQERKQGVIKYAELLEKYIELARNVTNPEENDAYPEKVRHSAAMRALYDNTGCDADLAEALHAAVLRSRMDRFHNDPVKERRIKRELLKILKSKDEVERVFKIIAEQEEYK